MAALCERALEGMLVRLMRVLPSQAEGPLYRLSASAAGWGAEPTPRRYAVRGGALVLLRHLHESSNAEDEIEAIVSLAGYEPKVRALGRSCRAHDFHSGCVAQLSPGASGPINMRGTVFELTHPTKKCYMFFCLFEDDAEGARRCTAAHWLAAVQAAAVAPWETSAVSSRSSGFCSSSSSASSLSPASSSPVPSATSGPCLCAFEAICDVGTGAYSTVRLCARRATRTLFALKSCDPGCASADASESGATSGAAHRLNWLMDERACLERVGPHPYVAALRYAFVGNCCARAGSHHGAPDTLALAVAPLHLVLDFLPGGDLFELARRQPLARFPEDCVRVWCAELVCALQHLHARGVVHRDVKLENLLLDEAGHVHLGDFGFATLLGRSEKAHTFCGTKWYVAPEMVDPASGGYEHAVDWWALGVVCYELLTGLAPFYSRSRERLFDRIRRSPLQFSAADAQRVSPEARAFVGALLTKDPRQRLGAAEGSGGAIRAHPWFATVDWSAVESKRLRPPLPVDLLAPAEGQLLLPSALVSAVPVPALGGDADSSTDTADAWSADGDARVGSEPESDPGGLERSRWCTGTVAASELADWRLREQDAVECYGYRSSRVESSQRRVWLQPRAQREWRLRREQRGAGPWCMLSDGADALLPTRASTLVRSLETAFCFRGHAPLCDSAAGALQMQPSLFR